jgi:hypothetical protein
MKKYRMPFSNHKMTVLELAWEVTQGLAAGVLMCAFVFAFSLPIAWILCALTTNCH